MPESLVSVAVRRRLRGSLTNNREVIMRKSVFAYQSVLLVGALLALASAPAMAETYVAGMAGITVP